MKAIFNFSAPQGLGTISVDDLTLETSEVIYLKLDNEPFLFTEEDVIHLDFDQQDSLEEKNSVSIRCKLDYATLEKGATGETIVFRDETIIDMLFSCAHCQIGTVSLYVDTQTKAPNLTQAEKDSYKASIALTSIDVTTLNSTHVFDGDTIASVQCEIADSQVISIRPTKGAINIQNGEDLEKVIAFLDANAISYQVADSPLELFEQEEAEFRLKWYGVEDQAHNPVEVTPELINNAAAALNSGEYLDYDELDDLIRNALIEYNNYILV